MIHRTMNHAVIVSLKPIFLIYQAVMMVVNFHHVERLVPVRFPVLFEKFNSYVFVRENLNS